MSAYVANSTGGASREFALSWFKQAPNLNPGAFEKLIERFGDDWKDEFSDYLDQQERRQLLGTLLKIRNDTAHGRSYGGASRSVATYKALVDDLHKVLLSGYEAGWSRDGGGEGSACGNIGLSNELSAAARTTGAA